MERMSKELYAKTMSIIHNLYDKGALMCEALGTESGDDTMSVAADEMLDILAEVMGDRGLPLSLDSDRVMRECGNDLPLTLWWAIVAEFDKAELNIEGEVITISTAAELYDLIVRLYPES